VTAEERAFIQDALGRDVVMIGEGILAAIERGGRAPRHAWRELLRALYSAAPDAMETPLGAVFTMAILRRINDGRNDARAHRGRPRWSDFVRGSA